MGENGEGGKAFNNVSIEWGERHQYTHTPFDLTPPPNQTANCIKCLWDSSVDSFAIISQINPRPKCQLPHHPHPPPPSSFQ